MSDLYLSRARLRHDVPSVALRDLLVPSGDGARAAVGHKLVWTLFMDSPDRERDFLWREAEPGAYYFLSRRPPKDQHGLFHVDPPKTFAPALRIGDRLTFSLRANATVARSAGPGERGKPCDVVMNALKSVAPGERAAARQPLVGEEGMKWLSRQGERHGFRILVAPENRNGGNSSQTRGAMCVVSYRTVRVAHRGPSARLGILDFDGTLEVSEPQAILAAIASGFGRAKAFGCGLMLIRRV